MRLKWMEAVLLAIFVMSGTGASLAQQDIEQFRPLVEISARRLLIGKQVALSKWDSGAAVEDPAR